jgi:DNA polymerase-1
MTAKRLFVVDAMAMAFRCYHAFGVRPLTTSEGLPVSAIYGSAIFLMKLIEDEKPDYLVIATDSKEPTFRHQLYPEYKANRTEMPQDLAIQLPYLFELFAALQVPLIKTPGLEADDLIGSIVSQNASDELACFIVSGDKDFMQLVNHNIKLYTPKKGGEVSIIDSTGVREKFGCTPEQVIDVLALIGDSSDNVPGVPGIGEKGAAKLIHDFGSIESIYQRIDEITNNRQREALKNNRSLAELSRRLVTIERDVKLPFTLAEFQFEISRSLGNPELHNFLRRMEFTSLEKRVQKYAPGSAPLDAPKAKTKPSVAKSDPNPPPVQTSIPQQTAVLGPVGRLITSHESLIELSDALSRASHFAFDTETTGLNCITDRPIGVSFALPDHSNFYIPMAGYHDQLIPESAIQGFLKKALEESTAIKIAHNLKFDFQMLNNVGVHVAFPICDTMICSHLINPISRSHGLDQCTLDHLGFTKIPTSELIGKDAARSMVDVPTDLITRYACEDALATIRLYEIFMPTIDEMGLRQVLDHVELPLIPVLARMEQAGIYVDSEILSEISEDLDRRGKELEALIYEAAGKTFNIQSTKQLATVLFEELKIHEQLGIKKIKKTKTGFSTDSSVLESLSEHPLANSILEFRTVSKLKNTYVDSLPQLINPQTDRIHTSFHQTGTATGRLSSSDPNLQNIPIRSDLGKQIRRAFRAMKSGHVILSADYSQVELRLLADLANEPVLVDAFQRGQDIHRATASKIFGLSEDQVDATLRSRAKAINFGIIYGMGPQRLARETGVSVQEAKEFIEKYFAGFPAIHQYIDHSIEFARKYGYTRTILGRRRPVPELNSSNQGERVMGENIAVNSPVQGSAADLIKCAMVTIDREFSSRNLKARMLLQVHDELVFEVPADELAQVKDIVRSKMEGALSLKAPLHVDMGVGSNWLEAH